MGNGMRIWWKPNSNLCRLHEHQSLTCWRPQVQLIVILNDYFTPSEGFVSEDTFCLWHLKTLRSSQPFSLHCQKIWILIRLTYSKFKHNIIHSLKIKIKQIWSSKKQSKRTVQQLQLNKHTSNMFLWQMCISHRSSSGFSHQKHRQHGKSWNGFKTKTH